MTTGSEPTSTVTSGKTVLIVGATSSLAQALCHTLAKASYGLILAGRDADELALLSGDLATRFGGHYKVLAADLLDADFSPEIFIEQAGDFDDIIITTGDMGGADPTDLPNLAYTIHINYTLPAQIATVAALRLSKKTPPPLGGRILLTPPPLGGRILLTPPPLGGRILLTPPPLGGRIGGGQSCASKQVSPHPNPPPNGEGASTPPNGEGKSTIVIISSVAGDRGRQSNYAYGSAKAALSAFASGLRNRFYRQGVHVMTVKPGFIDTPMTWGMNSPLIASREYVAEHIVIAMQQQKNTIYVPFFWRYIMLLIIHIPEKIFKKLKL